MQREVTLRVDEAIYAQFMGTISLFRQVEVVGECEVNRRGRGGRPLCKALKALGWIDRETDCQAFIDLFSGGEFRRHIVWTGQANVLAELFRRLVKERSLVALPEKHSLWVTVNGHFWDKQNNQEFGTERLRNTHIPYNQGQTIAYLVDMLDQKYTLDDLRMMIESQR